MKTSSEPRAADALYEKASALHDAGASQDALALLDEGVRRYEWSSRLWSLMGLLRFEASRYADAEESFSRAIALSPALPFALFMRGRAREELDRPAEAVVDFLACLACQPSRVDALLAIVRTLIACKEAKRARTFLERIASLKPTDAENADAQRLGERLAELDDELRAVANDPDPG
jgi:tetratricopeptide (TPR) repeat protein